ncbi:MAG: hypothetical protein HXY39_04410 [Chloroflexi bacterium]|nr:hypothetical protein [Chloroflexota bacterium]
MMTLMKDSGLNGLKGSVQYCPDCGRPTVHYRVPGGLPICNACGYNADLANYCAQQQQPIRLVPPTVRRKAV